MDLIEIGINMSNRVDSPRDTDYWRALVNATQNLLVPQAIDLDRSTHADSQNSIFVKMNLAPMDWKRSNHNMRIIELFASQTFRNENKHISSKMRKTCISTIPPIKQKRRNGFYRSAFYILFAWKLKGRVAASGVNNKMHILRREVINPLTPSPLSAKYAADTVS